MLFLNLNCTSVSRYVQSRIGLFWSLYLQLLILRKHSVFLMACFFVSLFFFFFFSKKENQQKKLKCMMFIWMHAFLKFTKVAESWKELGWGKIYQFFHLRQISWSAICTSIKQIVVPLLLWEDGRIQEALYHMEAKSIKFSITAYPYSAAVIPKPQNLLWCSVPWQKINK